jgi:hypothetical protein
MRFRLCFGLCISNLLLGYYVCTAVSPQCAAVFQFRALGLRGGGGDIPTMSANPAVRKAAEELVQSICEDTNAAAVSITRDSLNELKHLHGISDKISANAAALVSLLDENSETLLQRHEKILSTLTDLKGAVVKSSRIQTLQWAITYVKTSQPSEIVGIFDYIPVSPPAGHRPGNAQSSKALVQSILFTFLGGKGHFVTGCVGLGCYTNPSKEAIVVAEAKFKQALSEQIKGLTGLETKYFPQPDGKIAIFLSS